MKETEKVIKIYLENLKSKEPIPGGGAASALGAAEGVALVMMVGNLTVGKGKYEKFEKVNVESLTFGEELLQDLMDLIDEDANAFNKVSEAYKLPKETKEEKEIRSKKISDSAIFATKVPVRVMEAALAGLKLTAGLMGKSNPNVISDLGTAAIKLEGAIKGSWLNVIINLPSIKSSALKEEFRKKGEEIYMQGEEIGRKIYEQVIETLEGNDD